jgi:hypothetical protein
MAENVTISYQKPNGEGIGIVVCLIAGSPLSRNTGGNRILYFQISPNADNREVWNGIPRLVYGEAQN